MDPQGIAVDDDGNLFIADTLSHSIRRVDAATGFITTVAGVSQAGNFGDGGPATQAGLFEPSDVDVDSAGNLYIADRGNHQIRKVDTSGNISTLAGVGIPGFNGDTVPAVAALLDNPTSVAFDEETGSLFVSDLGNARIRQIFSGGGIRTFAGNGQVGFSGDGGPATRAKLGNPLGITLDAEGNLYFAEILNQRIRMVIRASETITTFAGTGEFAMCDNVPPLSACFRNPTDVTFDEADDSILVADSASQRIRRIPLSGDDVTTIAGTGFAGFSGDGGPAGQAQLWGPGGVVAHPNFGYFIADEANGRIRQVESGIITTVAGNGNVGNGGDGGPALAASLGGPQDVASDVNGNILIADTLNQKIRRIDTQGIIETIAGNGDAAFAGDGGQATQASLRAPGGVAADRQGNIYIADTQNQRVRRVAPNGIITTFFGNGGFQSTGDGGLATNASVKFPRGLAVYENPSGTERYLYVTEGLENKVRRINLNTNIVTHFAGSASGAEGFSGDGGNATQALLDNPSALATDASGNLYIADTSNDRVRRVANNIITTFAGNGVFAYAGDGGLAISASLANPDGVAVGPLGNVFINDSSNLRVRVVTGDGKIHTAAGNGFKSGQFDGEGGNPLDDIGDGGDATSATFTRNTGVTIDPNGNAFISDGEADTVRGIADISNLYGQTGSPPDNEVSGRIKHATSLQGVPNVLVEVRGPTTLTESTSSSGSYNGDELETATWLVEPRKLGGFGSNVISGLDASFVLQELVGSRNLTDEQKLACDVTGDGTLSSLDATRILQRSINAQTVFPTAENCDSDWLFVPDASPAQSQSEIQPLLQGGTTCRMGAIQYSPLNGTPDGQDFKAVVIGDCTGNWSAGAGASLSSLARTHAANTATVSIGPERRTRRRLRLPVAVSGVSGFHAFALNLGYDASALRLVRLRARGTASNAIVTWDEPVPGQVAAVLASGSEIAGSSRAVLVADFELIKPGARRAIRSAAATVDESNARVRMQRMRRRR